MSPVFGERGGCVGEIDGEGVDVDEAKGVFRRLGEFGTAIALCKGVRGDHAGDFGRTSEAAIEYPRYPPPACKTGSRLEEDAARQEARFPPE